MSTLTFGTMKIRGHKVEKASWFPAIREQLQINNSADLDESDGLFFGYGLMPDSLPYTLQDNYDTPETELTFQTAVLEKQYLRATFVPELGGRMLDLRSFKRK